MLTTPFMLAMWPGSTHVGLHGNGVGGVCTNTSQGVRQGARLRAIENVRNPKSDATTLLTTIEGWPRRPRAIA